MGFNEIATLSVVIILIVVFLAIPNKTAYKCPKCGQTFVPKKAQLLGIHSYGPHMLKCPHCGKTSMMAPAGRE